MKGLGCSREEAEQVYESDKAIDHDEKMDFDLSPNKLAVSKKFAHTGTRKTPVGYKFPKKERKPNATKTELIKALFNFVVNDSNLIIQHAEIINKERQFIFELNGEKFEVTLVQKRKPKK